MWGSIAELILRSPDQTFEILINDESVRTGSLLEDFDPAVNPPKEIGKSKLTGHCATS